MSKFEDTRIPFGLKNGIPYEATAVERGLKCGCICPKCGRKLQANQGPKIPAYFSHDPDADSQPCKGALESSIHIMSKYILSEIGNAMFPSLTITVSDHDIHGSTHSEEEMIQPQERKYFDRVISEKKLESIKPDIIAFVSGEPILIEIAFSHFVDVDKKSTIQQLGLASIEIDVSHLTYSVTKNELQQCLIEDVENKKWLSFPDAIEAKIKLHEKLKVKIDEINERIRPTELSTQTLDSIGRPTGNIGKKFNKSQVTLVTRRPITCPQRWLLCEACRYVYNVDAKDIPKDATTYPCIHCRFELSLKQYGE